MLAGIRSMGEMAKEGGVLWGDSVTKGVFLSHSLHANLRKTSGNEDRWRETRNWFHSFRVMRRLPSVFV